MARKFEDLGMTVVVINPDQDCSADAGRRMIDEILALPEDPSPHSLHAAEILRELRSPEQ